MVPPIRPRTRVPADWELLQPGDELQIRLLKSDGDPISDTINSTGHIALPLVGEIKAAGYTIFEFEEILRQKYVPDIYAAGTFDAGLVNVYTFQSPGLPCDCSDDPHETIPLRRGQFPLRKPASLADVLRDCGLEHSDPRWEFLRYTVRRSRDEGYGLNTADLETFMVQNGDWIQIPHSFYTF